MTKETDASHALCAASWLMAGGAMAQKVVTLWHPYNHETDMIHVGIKAFNESQKDYRIEPRLVPYTQLTAEMIKAVATGTPPDLVTLNDPVVASFASQDQLIDITDRIKNSKVIDLDVYYKGPQTSGVWKGRRYSIAREVERARALLQRRPVPRQGPRSGQAAARPGPRCAAAAEKLTDPSKRVFGIGFCAHASEQSTFQFLPVVVAGGRLDRQARSAGSDRSAAVLDRPACRRATRRKDVITQQQGDVINSFMAGNYAMAVGGPWELPRFRRTRSSTGG